MPLCPPRRAFQLRVINMGGGGAAGAAGEGADGASASGSGGGGEEDAPPVLSFEQQVAEAQGKAKSQAAQEFVRAYNLQKASGMGLGVDPKVSWQAGGGSRLCCALFFMCCAVHAGLRWTVCAVCCAVPTPSAAPVAALLGFPLTMHGGSSLSLSPAPIHSPAAASRACHPPLPADDDCCGAGRQDHPPVHGGTGSHAGCPLQQHNHCGWRAHNYGGWVAACLPPVLPGPCLLGSLLACLPTMRQAAALYKHPPDDACLPVFLPAGGWQVSWHACPGSAPGSGLPRWLLCGRRHF